ncbi:transporter substrate-binding domain-containing protein [Devosia sp. 2618]|uniref:substrate-binding periplasmic protein n=1 Tax=Devosia sp. 2618 TaxID=3156454 RepID=UPI00339322EA
MARFLGVLRQFSGVGLVLLLLFAVALLPPDTSLSEVHSTAMLKVCVPPSYPPLVTGDPERPGVDIELLQAVAKRLNVSLGIYTNNAMGRDFNPRNWNLNRAQCQVIAGGVVDSDQTRSFLETGPSYSDTGWAMISPKPLASLKDLNVGALTLAPGLDRIGLASYLRAEGAKTHVVSTPAALAEGVTSGKFEAGVTEAMLAAALAEDNNLTVAWVSPQLARYHLVFGLWKGDITLKRAITDALAALDADGTTAAIFDRYGVKPID